MGARLSSTRRSRQLGLATSDRASCTFLFHFHCLLAHWPLSVLRGRLSRGHGCIPSSPRYSFCISGSKELVQVLMHLRKFPSHLAQFAARRLGFLEDRRKRSQFGISHQRSSDLRPLPKRCLQRGHYSPQTAPARSVASQRHRRLELPIREAGSAGSSRERDGMRDMMGGRHLVRTGAYFDYFDLEN